MPTLLPNRSSLEKLRQEMGSRLVQTECVAPPMGVRTGWGPMDQFLIWRGFPKAAVSLLVTEAGGATTLWERSAALITQNNQWVAWVNGDLSVLNPWDLRQRSVNLSKLLCVASPKSEKQRFWVLQELMSLCLFELIGCDCGPLAPREAQVRQLKKVAMRYQTALVLFTSSTRPIASSFYSLILEFKKDHVVVRRALHRPTPHLLERRDLYADTLPQLTAGRLAFGS